MKEKAVKRFDMAREPLRPVWFWRALMWLLSAPAVSGHKTVVHRKGTEGIKPPYLLLCNHNAFFDFKVATTILYPAHANYVVAIDGFIGREWLLRQVGCICKRKFTNDVTLIRQLKRVVDKGDVAVVYPEARYSLCGTTAVLPASLGKLCKMLGVPVVTLVCHGHHVNSPFWNLHDRKVRPTEADFNLQFTAEELKSATPDEINAKLVQAFQYDDFAWQKEKGIRTPYKGRAEGLHKVLYQCPHCGTEFRMASKGTKLYCEHCGKSWTLSELNELSADSGETEFSHIPDWYEWERENVRREVQEGRYSSGKLEVLVRTLPNAKRFLVLGKGTLVHDMNGFRVRCKDALGREFAMDIAVPSAYSCHIEYEYLGKFGDCVDLNTLEDTWYIYPFGRDFAVTKFALATEELYYAHRRAIGKPCPPGLA